MEKTISLISISLFTVIAYYQHFTITYQGKLLDASGNAITQKCLCDFITFLWHTDYHRFSNQCKSLLCRQAGVLSVPHRRDLCSIIVLKID